MPRPELGVDGIILLIENPDTPQEVVNGLLHELARKFYNDREKVLNFLIDASRSKSMGKLARACIARHILPKLRDRMESKEKLTRDLEPSARLVRFYSEKEQSRISEPGRKNIAQFLVRCLPGESEASRADRDTWPFEWEFLCAALVNLEQFKELDEREMIGAIPYLRDVFDRTPLEWNRWNLFPQHLVKSWDQTPLGEERSCAIIGGRAAEFKRSRNLILRRCGEMIHVGRQRGETMVARTLLSLLSVAESMFPVGFLDKIL